MVATGGLLWLGIVFSGCAWQTGTAGNLSCSGEFTNFTGFQIAHGGLEG
jgi:hypothetical protein